MTATLDTQALKKLDQAHHLHPFTDFEDYAKHGGRIVSRAEHIYIYDSDGNKIQDGMSGLWCCNLGYSQDRIKQAVAEQLAELPFYNNFFRCSNQPAAELAARLSQVTPERFQHVFFTNSGSEANDTQIKLVHRYFDLLGKPEKKLIISRQNAYHGSTIAASTLGGMSAMHKQTMGLDYVHHIQQPHWFEEGADLDPQAWPSGKGEILAGLNPEVISRYRERYGENWSEPCLRDFQEQIREYEIIRRELDQLLDRLKKEVGLSESEAISPEQMTELEQKLPEDLRQKEKELRQKAYAYIGRVSVEVGDVVTFPALQVHSLQHGIRVIEFQTPHYERLIVMFAQKVLTQNHWDTDRAMDLINTEPYRLPEPQLLTEEDGYLEERIVDFPDFSSERIRMDENISRKFQCEGRYHLIICVKGKLRLESQSGSSLELLPEEAVFLPASTSFYRVTNSGADSMIFLRAVPVNAHSAKLD